jgi:ankyrin repeat protein
MMQFLKLAGLLSVALVLTVACSKGPAPKSESPSAKSEITAAKPADPIAALRAQWLAEFDEQPVTERPAYPNIVIAADSADFDAVMYFLQNGASVHEEGQYRFSALHQAASRGANRLVKYLLAKGADVNHINDDGFVPLHTAAMTGDSMTVRLLMDAGSIIYVRDNNSMTPLHLSALKGNLSSAGELIRRGADVNDETESKWTPLRVAEQYHMHDFMQFLRDHGATK